MATATNVKPLILGVQEFEASRLHPGNTDQLGATVTNAGINFAIECHGGTSVTVALYREPFDERPYAKVTLIETPKGSGLWCRFVDGLGSGTLYNLFVDGDYTPSVNGRRYNLYKPLWDPRAMALTGNTHWPGGDRNPVGYSCCPGNDPDRHLRMSTSDSFLTKCVAVLDDFDWQGQGLTGPWTKSVLEHVIYEANVLGMTGHPNCAIGDRRGTFFGMVDRIPHVSGMGFTAIELMPSAEYDSYDTDLRDRKGRLLENVWGYNQDVFGAPNAKYSLHGRIGQQVKETQYMVREYHKADIAVGLDVVFNHTREGNHFGPTISLRGLDNQHYYLLVPGQPQFYYDLTGCGNTLNCNDPVTRRLILDILRRWRLMYHIDFFRFDLAAIFRVDTDGQVKSKTPIIREIEEDPVLGGCVVDSRGKVVSKGSVPMIAEPWSGFGGPNFEESGFSDRLWYQWNSRYPTTVRRFLRGDKGMADTLARCIGGSRDRYPLLGADGEPLVAPCGAINYLATHDGMSWRDLSEYWNKQNGDNGEGGQDGVNDNYCFNVTPFEGPSGQIPVSDNERKQIERLRRQQLMNGFVILMGSQGTPQVTMGDECGHTRLGNNNAWAQRELNLINWEHMDEYPELVGMVRGMISLRKRYDIGGYEKDGKPVLRKLVFHGAKPFCPDHGYDARFVAWAYAPYAEADARPGHVNQDIMFLANMWTEGISVELPKLPEGKHWYRVVDTGLNANRILPDENGILIERDYFVQPRTSVVLIVR